MRKKHFGIELEFTGITRQKAAEAFGIFFDREVKEEIKKKRNGFEFKEYSVKDFYDNVWTITLDRSITPEKMEDMAVFQKKHYTDLSNAKTSLPEFVFDYKCELVSPILTAETIDILLSLVDIIAAMGGKVNDSCGIHVHIDRPETNEEMQRILKRFLANQSFILEDFHVSEKRMEKYCKPLPECLSKMNPKYDTKEWLNDMFRLMSGECQTLRDVRYYVLNFYALIEHNTIEYRFFDATLNKQKILRILNWVLYFSYEPEQYEEFAIQMGIGF